MSESTEDIEDALYLTSFSGLRMVEDGKAVYATLLCVCPRLRPDARVIGAGSRVLVAIGLPGGAVGIRSRDLVLPSREYDAHARPENLVDWGTMP